MRLLEVTGYTIEEMLAELDRRGFLKGLGGAAALAAVPSLAKAATGNDAKAEMDKIVRSDPKIKSYSIQGDTVTIQIDNKIEKGYKNFLTVQKKGNFKEFNHKDALSYYGFNDQYARDVSKMTGIKNVRFEIADDNKFSNSKTSKPNTKEYYKNPEKWGDPPNEFPFDMTGQVDGALKSFNKKDKRATCFYISSAILFAKDESPAMYEKLQGWKKQIGC